MIGTLIGAFVALAIGPPAPAQASTVLSALPQAQAVVRPQAPTKRRPESVGVKTSSPSVFVADVTTGSVLFAKDAHRLMPIASLSKLVTAMVVLDQKPDFTKTLTFIDGDFDNMGKPVFRVGEEVTFEDALKSMLVGSVNASANVLARTTLGKDKFVEAMNAKTRSFGLKSPIFFEPSGIDPRNQASAADVAAIITYASSYPKIREFAGYPAIDVKGLTSGQNYHILSTNLLLGSFLNKKPYGVIAAKTGSLPEAGFCMAQVTKNAEGHEIVAVELGSDNHFARFQDIKALTMWAFETYQWK